MESREAGISSQPCEAKSVGPGALRLKPLGFVDTRTLSVMLNTRIGSEWILESNLDEIKGKVNKALLKLYEKDKYLIKNDLNERTIAHKFSNYIQEEFNEFDVDCEYNKNVDEAEGNKNIYFLKQEYLELNKNFKETVSIDNIEYVRMSIYPDIIIHKRGSNLQNLLIIGIKKSTNREDRNFDFSKLKCYTDTSRHNKLGYAWGLFVEFKTKCSTPPMPELIWYKNGEII
ncbi:hypothetical protein [Paenibacillus sp. DRB1-1]|uniref:hypothetical protein n=1 Tax=Paenibacillus sp. DRB1-1 TaxID=3422309 RepID=UPI003F987426